MSHLSLNLKQKSQKKIKQQQNEQLFKRKHPKTRFAQVKLFLLVLRHIGYRRISNALDQLKLAKKRRFYNLSIFKIIIYKNLKQSFAEIQRYGKNSVLQQIRVYAKRINIQLFLVQFLGRLQRKTITNSFTKIKKASIINYEYSNRLNLYFSNNLRKTQILNLKEGFRKIKSVIQNSKINKLKMNFSSVLLSNLNKKNMNQSFQNIILLSEKKIYDDKFNSSQALRKLFYEYQNNKAQTIAKQRQNLHSLKSSIDTNQHQMYTKIGQMKRQKAIKTNQVQLNVKLLEKKYAQQQLQLIKYQRQIQKIKLIANNKKRNQIQSKQSQLKVHNLYNSLKYDNQERSQIQSSTKSKSSIYTKKMVLIKQKFKQFLSKDFQQFRSTCPSYHIYENIRQRNLICYYEKVPLQSIKPSQQYTSSFQQNQWLKQLINSLISYDLLKEKGDQILKSNSILLQQLFETMFVCMQQERQNEENSQMKDSFISYRSSKSIKKKSSIKTSILSNKSVK